MQILDTNILLTPRRKHYLKQSTCLFAKAIVQCEMPIISRRSFDDQILKAFPYKLILQL